MAVAGAVPNRTPNLNADAEAAREEQLARASGA